MKGMSREQSLNSEIVQEESEGNEWLESTKLKLHVNIEANNPLCT